MTIALRANNDGSATVLVQGTPRMTIDSSGNILGTVTPPFADSSFKLADTEFVQRASGSYRGVVIVSSSVLTSYNVTSADLGKDFIVNIDSASVTLTLPDIQSVAVGAVFRFNVAASSGTNTMRVAPNGSDVIFGGSGFSYTNAVPAVMRSGEFIEVVRNGAQWSVIDSPLTFDYNGAVFQGSNAGNGWRRLAGGTIIQWGLSLAVPATSNLTTNFPIPFPVSVYQVTACFSDTANTSRTVTTNINGLNNSGVSFRNPDSQPSQFRYVAIGS